MVFIVATGLLLWFFTLSVWLGRDFFLTAVCYLGVAALAVAVIKKGKSNVCALLFLGFVAFAAIGYIALCEIEKIRKRKAEKRRKRAVAKWLGVEKFENLPEREHSFLKERLLTALSDKNANGDAVVACAKDVKLGFVYRMLAELKKAPLSAADRLETENLSESLKKYVEKSDLTGADLSGFNDSMSAVLKLSAKYAL
jgi:hypothetical protein